MSAFAAFLAQSKAASTVSTYLAAVKHHHLAQGFDANLISSPQLAMALRGMQRHQTRRRTRLPITYSLLESILQHLATDFPGRQHDKKMLKAAISLAFHGLLRASEFTSPTTVSYNPKKTLLKSDITIRHHTIRLQIKASKTDQRGHGQTILLGCTNSSTCPISLIEQYLEASHHPSPHLPLFHFADGKLLMRYSLATSLKECIIAVGENPKHFSTHSIRIGGATAAAAAGITPSIIQELGRWRSNCFRQYTRHPNRRLAGTAYRMATATNLKRLIGHPCPKQHHKCCHSRRRQYHAHHSRRRVTAFQ